MDIGSAVGRDAGLTAEQLAALPNHAASDEFDELEKLALDYTDAMTRTPASVPVELFAKLKDALGDAALVELTSVIAWENYRARFNRAFDVAPAGFSEGSFCVLPARAATVVER